MRRAGPALRIAIGSGALDRDRPVSIVRHPLPPRPVSRLLLSRKKGKSGGCNGRTTGELVRGRLVGDGTLAIRSARTVAEAGPGDITFIESERFVKLLKARRPRPRSSGPTSIWGGRKQAELDRDRSRRPDGGVLDGPHPLDRRCRTAVDRGPPASLGRADRTDRSKTWRSIPSPMWAMAW